MLAAVDALAPSPAEAGAAQEPALEVWGSVYAVASGILHAGASITGEAVQLYAELPGAGRHLMVPLLARAPRMLELAPAHYPGREAGTVIASWTDPRATWFFFNSDSVPAWLEVLQEHTPHLLLADEDDAGTWLAARFLAHLATVAPEKRKTCACPWSMPARSTSRRRHALYPKRLLALNPHR